MSNAKVTKLLNEKTIPMLKAGSPAYTEGPTCSGTLYPKGRSVNMTPDFNPMKDKDAFEGWLTKGV